LNLQKGLKLIAGAGLRTIGDIWKVDMLPLQIVFFKPSDWLLEL
jgi:hypothetical protein